MSCYEEAQKYTVYDNRTDEPVAVCATSRECAKAMGVKINTFHAYLTPSAIERKRWTIIKEGKCVEFHEDHDTTRKTIGQAMRICRQKRGYSKMELATKTGIHVSNIKSYENDTAYPRITTVIDIADALNVSIDELIGRK